MRIRILSKGLKSKPSLSPEDGIRNSAGGWADGGEELENWLEALQASRNKSVPAMSSTELDDFRCTVVPEEG